MFLLPAHLLQLSQSMVVLPMFVLFVANEPTSQTPILLISYAQACMEIALSHYLDVCCSH